MMPTQPNVLPEQKAGVFYRDRGTMPEPPADAIWLVLKDVNGSPIMGGWVARDRVTDDLLKRTWGYVEANSAPDPGPVRHLELV